MKFGQLIEFNRRNIFLQKSGRKWGRETSSRPLFMTLKQKVCSLVSITSIVLNLAYNKNKLYENLEYWSRDILNFDFLENGLEIVFPPHSVYGFSGNKLFIAFTSWDIGQYVYCNCLFPRLRRYKFWN